MEKKDFFSITLYKVLDGRSIMQSIRLSRESPFVSILTYLLKEGKMKPAEMARALGISRSMLNYHMKRAINEGIITGFVTYVDPLVYQKSKWITFKRPNRYSILFELENGQVIYESVDEVKDGIEIKREEYFALSDKDQILIEALKRNPSAMEKELATLVSLSPRATGRHIRFLLGKFVRILPIMDLSKFPYLYAIKVGSKDVYDRYADSAVFNFATRREGYLIILSLQQMPLDGIRVKSYEISNYDMGNLLSKQIQIA
ncbi:hypothetical protein HS7_01450 [Sulfolobales archaeon HS-7]|nr:hypothetical protein HS7_01450 [Sulfolobales archaeon HS-7]